MGKMGCKTSEELAVSLHMRTAGRIPDSSPEDLLKSRSLQDLAKGAVAATSVTWYFTPHTTIVCGTWNQRKYKKSSYYQYKVIISTISDQ